MSELINETENECNKYITTTIEKSLLDQEYFNSLLLINNKSEDIDLFKIIEIGKYDELNKYKFNELNFESINEYGLTVLHYAVKYGDVSFLKQALKLGAKIDQTNIYGYTLLEFACLEKDPNMIKFLLLYGVSMKKHLIVRKEKKYLNQSNQIDFILIQIIIMNTDIKYNKIKYLNWIIDLLSINDKITIQYNDKNSDISLEYFILKIYFLINYL
jgi:hypothetical protein